MDKINIKISSWNRFITRFLVVAPDLLGKELQFKFEDSSVKIKLPGDEHINQGKDYDNLVSIGARRARDNKPIEYDIHKVDVEVSLAYQTEVPSEVLTRSPNAYDLISEQKQKKLNETADAHKLIAGRAFEYWIRVVRWKCMNSSIGRPERHDYESGWGTYLIDDISTKKIWVGSRVAHLRDYKTISLEQWDNIDSALQQGLWPPIYFELIHDAEEQIKIGEYNRALVDLAVACETYMHIKVLRLLPKDLDQPFVKHIERANVRIFINNFFPSFLGDNERKQFKELKSNLHELFDQRNNLLHTRHMDELTFDECQEYLKTASKLISIKFDLCI